MSDDRPPPAARVGPVRRDDATAAFFDAAAAGRLLLRRCAAGHWEEPAAEACGSCGATDLTWAPAAGTATLVSWTVVAGPDGSGPTVVVIAELAEGPWWWSQLAGAAPERLAVGAPLRIAFARAEGVDGAEAVPVFVPAAADPGGAAHAPGGR